MEDYSQYNQIDMECSCCDDDDSFCVKPIKVTSFKKDDNLNYESEDRDFNSNTGIIIDLSDDDNINIPKKVIKADIVNNNIVIDKNFDSFNDDNLCYNGIDMECNCCEDEDDDDFDPSIISKNNYNKTSLKDLFADDDIAFEDKELVDEEILDERKSRKKSVQPGQVEDDYWDKLSKKHEKTNVKGAYNTYFHLAGDPEKEMKLFNHDMGSDYSSAESSVAGLGAADGSIGAVGVASAGGEGGGMGESLNNNYKRLYEDLLYLTGFEVLPADNGGYTVKDILSNIPQQHCSNFEDVKVSLSPYFEDTLIYPLQVKTKENINSCQDWCKWYTAENRERYPELQSDIAYCDLLANHWNDIDDINNREKNITESLEIHDQLNPKIWDENNKLLPEIKNKILDIVKAFKQSLEENNVNVKIKDIVLVGSNVNYNYDDTSDLDIHIIADPSLDCANKHLPIIYDAYRSLFNKKYDITLNGIEAEIYVENNLETQAHSNGIYSLTKGWLSKPNKYQIPVIDNIKLNNLVQKLSDDEFKLETNLDTTVEDIDKYTTDLYKLRQDSISKEGEFGLGNLAFKEIRRQGLLDNLKEIRDEIISKNLSL